jgi:predicted nucleic acid-binding protein
MEAIERPDMPLVVCDAGPLIHLDETGCLDLLADFPTVLVPPSVWIEVGRNRSRALTASYIKLTQMSPLAPPSPQLLALSQVLSLHSGEWDAIRLCLDHPGAMFLTDDTAARLAASSLQIRSHGSIGIMIRAIRRGQRTKQEVLSMLRALPATSSLHIKRSLLQEIIAEVDSSLL